MAGCEITTVYTGIAGGHIKGFTSHGIVAVKDKEVRPPGRRPGHRRGQGGRHPARPRGHPRPAAGVHRRRPGRHQGAARHERRAPRGQGRTSSPARSPRRRTSSSAPSAPASTSPTSCCSRSPRSQAMLSEDEKELGVCLVDIGGGTTDIAIFHERRHRAHRGHLAGRQPPHQRHRGRAAHPDPRGRAHQEAVRLRPGLAWSTGARPSRCPASAAAPRACSRATSSPRSSSRASRRSSCWCSTRSRRPASRSCSPPGVVITGGSTLLAGHARDGRGGARPAGAPRHAARHRRPRRRGEEPHVRHRGRAGALRRHSSGAGSPYFKIREENVYRKVKNRMKEWLGRDLLAPGRPDMIEFDGQGERRRGSRSSASAAAAATPSTP